MGAFLRVMKVIRCVSIKIAGVDQPDEHVRITDFLWLDFPKSLLIRRRYNKSD